MKHAISLCLLALIGAMVHTMPVSACGGLFCQNIPVDQAGEQILFNEDGEYVTAMVRILYEGDAEDFSWVVPVPSTPELSTGSDLFFDELDNTTQPIFRLNRSGNGACFSVLAAESGTTGGSVGSTDGGTADSDGVVIEQELSVGPFDIQIVSSTNPNEMANWLVDNDYDLSSRGEELITPYVNDGMKFVAVKLRSGQSSGSIQPLIMKYKSNKPMVPIKLTAVAAMEDMGVLVWLVSNARGVPDNYLHVVPNYTRLNWYTGPRNAYGSYQSLITDAMNEAGGQGFATDYAGNIDASITEFMSSAEALDEQLAQFDTLQNDAEFLVTLYSSRFSESLQQIYARYLPLPQGQDESVYFEPLALMSTFTNDELAQARIAIRQAYIDVDIEPLRASRALLSEGRYLTRLYTTLSADEMTVDPSFEFNPNMETQSREREATLVENCVNDETAWSLILGKGTGREGETVMSGTFASPTAVPPGATSQSAVRTTARTSGSAMPDIRVSNDFEPLNLDANGEAIESDDTDNTDIEGTSSGGTTDEDTTGENDVAEVSSSGSSFLGSTSQWWIYISVALLAFRRSRTKL